MRRLVSSRLIGRVLAGAAVMAALSVAVMNPFQQDSAPKHSEAQNFNPFLQDANFIN